MQLNLLDCNVTRKRIVPRIIVVEPDFLVDISSIANCFEDYGHHPLLFTVNRLQARTATAATLLGNFAGTALDDIINNPNYNINETLKANFRNKLWTLPRAPTSVQMYSKRTAQSRRKTFRTLSKNSLKATTATRQYSNRRSFAKVWAFKGVSI